MRKQNDRRELTFLNNKSTNNYEYKTFERNYLSQRPHGEERHQNDEEEERVRAPHFEAHRRVGVRHPDGKRARVRGLEHPADVEFAQGDGRHHQPARDDPRHRHRHHHAHEDT